ncbi:RcnB family protein [Croceibacterium soli]|nr:RcnB family protein [Croceibacterium soli]
MKRPQIYTGGAIAALATALAFAAVPAQAQDGERRGWRTAPAEERQAAQSERRAERQAERSAAQAQRAEQREARTEARPQRNSREAVRTQHRNDPPVARGGWNTGNAPPMRSVRNPAYVDPNRNVDSRDRDDRRDRERDWRDDRRDGNRDWRDDRRDSDRWRDGRRDNDRDWRDGRRHDYSRWDRRWRDDSRYNWYNYRNYNRHVYRPGRYYSPYRHYNYRRLGIGVFLDSLFYSNRYWINDPWQYRLPEVYGPYRWVRYYDDALLVDVRRGEVVDVIHDFFW